MPLQDSYLNEDLLFISGLQGLAFKELDVSESITAQEVLELLR